MEKNASLWGFFWSSFGLSFFFNLKGNKNLGDYFCSAGSTTLPVTASLQGAGPDKKLQIRAAKGCHPAGALEGDQGFRGSV